MESVYSSAALSDESETECQFAVRIIKMVLSKIQMIHWSIIIKQKRRTFHFKKRTVNVQGNTHDYYRF